MPAGPPIWLRSATRPIGGFKGESRSESDPGWNDMGPSRSAFVTGAARGIGKAIAERLVADGFGVSLADLPSLKTSLTPWW